MKTLNLVMAAFAAMVLASCADTGDTMMQGTEDPMVHEMKESGMKPMGERDRGMKDTMEKSMEGTMKEDPTM